MHDKANQNLEANLDVVLDRLRQGASPEVRPEHVSVESRSRIQIFPDLATSISGILKLYHLIFWVHSKKVLQELIIFLWQFA